MGTVQYGHYTCFVRKDGQWYHCNDIQIQKVEDMSHLETPYASCLVYVKKNTVV
jgi:ubiquitin C-terminal hydrolase